MFDNFGLAIHSTKVCVGYSSMDSLRIKRAVLHNYVAVFSCRSIKIPVTPMLETIGQLKIFWRLSQTRYVTVSRLVSGLSPRSKFHCV